MRSAACIVGAVLALGSVATAQLLSKEGWNRVTQYASASAETGSCEAVCQALGAPSSPVTSVTGEFCQPFQRLGASRQCGEGCKRSVLLAGERRLHAADLNAETAHDDAVLQFATLGAPTPVHATSRRTAA